MKYILGSAGYETNPSGGKYLFWQSRNNRKACTMPVRGDIAAYNVDAVHRPPQNVFHKGYRQ